MSKEPLSASGPLDVRKSKRSFDSAPVAEAPCADTVSKVIHKRRRKAPPKPSPSPAPLVNHFAAALCPAVNNLPASVHPDGGSASHGTRSSCAYLTKLQRRTPARPPRRRRAIRAAGGWASQASTPRSDRTKAREAPCISSTRGGGQSLPAPTRTIRHMPPSQELTHFAGLDWARDHHEVVSVDASGHIVADFRIAHTAEEAEGNSGGRWSGESRRLAALAGKNRRLSQAGRRRRDELRRGRRATARERGERFSDQSDERQTLPRAQNQQRQQDRSARRLGAGRCAAPGRPRRRKGIAEAGGRARGWRALAAQDPILAELRILCRSRPFPAPSIPLRLLGSRAHRRAHRRGGGRE